MSRLADGLPVVGGPFTEYTLGISSGDPLIRITALALLLLTPAASFAQEAPAEPSASSAPTLNVPVPAVKSKVKKKKVVETFQGEWSLVLPPELERMVSVMTMALDGADDAAFAPMNLTPQELNLVTGVRQGMASVPPEQQAEMREVLMGKFTEMFDSMFLRVTADELNLGMQGQDMTAKWTVIETDNNRLIVSVAEPRGDSRMTIYFEDADHIVMAADKEEQRLGWVRKGVAE